ncbi:unnamed protein product [marine sediment metagenome]|uniref:Uncharacterized protein n=1 Tax=marine sediment metagenome TaxID=412755 RepID=X1LKR7_9ZZZZ
MRGKVSGEANPGAASHVQLRPVNQPEGELGPEQPNPVSVKCPGCSQLLDITGKNLGSQIICPVCHAELAIFDPKAAVEPMRPPEGEGGYNESWNGYQWVKNEEGEGAESHISRGHKRNPAQ